jgi:hypothetical protein
MVGSAGVWGREGVWGRDAARARLLSADGLPLVEADGMGSGESTRDAESGSMCGPSSEDGGVGGRSLFTLSTRARAAGKGGGGGDGTTTPSSFAPMLLRPGDGELWVAARRRQSGSEKKWVVVCVVVVTVVVVVSARITGGAFPFSW